MSHALWRCPCATRCSARSKGVVIARNSPIAGLLSTLGDRLPSPEGAMHLAQPRPDTDRTLALGHSCDGVGLPRGELRRIGDVGKQLPREAGNLGLDGGSDQAEAT